MADRDRWRRGQSRQRLSDAALRAVAHAGPSAVSGRAIARDAGVYHPQIQQMFGSVDELVNTALLAERDRFMTEVFGTSDLLPDPLAIADFPEFWRAIVNVVLDPGAVSLRALADGGPVAALAARLKNGALGATDEQRLAVASVWAAAPLGALVFEEPLRRGLGIGADDWPACWRRLGSRLEQLAESPEFPTPSAEVERQPSRPPATQSTPSGGREKLVVAAEELLATRLESAVTGREIADRAGVNYGLISHYFGSKTVVFDEALMNLHQRFLDDVFESGQDQFEGGVQQVFSRHRPFLRAWASRLLGGRAVPEFRLLGMRRLMEQLIAARDIDSDDRTRRLDASGDALAATSLQLGWVLLQPLPTPSDHAQDAITPRLQAVHRWLLEPSIFPAQKTVPHS